MPITESAENIKAYQISDDEVRLSWDEGGYYQVYAKAPSGNWECVSGDEVVNGKRQPSKMAVLAISFLMETWTAWTCNGLPSFEN